MTTKPVMSMALCEDGLNAIAVTNLSGTCKIAIYSGAQPATTLTARSGTLLAQPVMNATPFGNAASGTSDGNATCTANSITSDTNAANTGTAGYFSIQNATPTVFFQGNVGTSGADLNLNTTSITAGDTVAITSFKITLQCGDGVS